MSSNNRGRGRGRGGGGSFRGRGATISTTSFNGVPLNYEEIQDYQQETPSQQQQSPRRGRGRPPRPFAPFQQQASASSSSSKRPSLNNGGGGHTGIGLRHHQASSPGAFGNNGVISSSSDNAFLRPVAFIKATSSLSSTMTDDDDDVAPATTTSPAALVAETSTSLPTPIQEKSSIETDLLASLQLKNESPTTTVASTSQLPADYEVEEEEEAIVDTIPMQQSFPHFWPPQSRTLSSVPSPSSSPSLPPSQDLFFVDTVGDVDKKTTASTDASQLLRPVSAASLANNDNLDDKEESDVSDTEELYRPICLEKHRQTAHAEQQPSPVAKSTRSFSIVLNDPVHQALPTIHPTPLPPAPDPVGLAILQELTSTARSNPKVSRAVKKKIIRREARERKKQRKRGETVARLIEEFDTDIADDSVLEQIDVLDVQEQGDKSGDILIAAKSLSGSKRRGPHASKARRDDAALQDYLQNIQGVDEDGESFDPLGFLRSTTAEHLNTDDLQDIADMEAEDDTFAFDMSLAQLLEAPEFTSDLDSDALQEVPRNGLLESTSTDESDVEAVELMKRSRSALDAQASLSESEDEEASESEGSSESEEIDDDYLDIDENAIRDYGYTNKPARGLVANKTPSLAFDELDEQLQKQWQKDRAKKAIKRQERYLKRLEAQPTKANRKKAKRAGVMGLEQSFLPEKHASDQAPDLHALNQRIRTFIEDSSRAEMTLPAMEKKYRFAVHMLADAYSLKSKSRGTGPSRHNVLYRTMHTSVRAANANKVQRYLSMTATWEIRTSSSGKSQLKGPQRTSSAPRNAEGRLVGEGADRIAADNIGHQMLAKMGWAAGEQIGRGGGLDEPLTAVVKTNKAGLGSGFVRYKKGLAELSV